MDFIVKRDNLREARFESSPSPALEEGQVRVRIKKFAFTANNVTYGAVGESIGYWKFFPATEGWGRIPVWGIAAVDESRHAELPEGERLYGYLPMSTELVLQPDAITPHGLVDASTHRAQLPVVYNQYTRLAAVPGYDRKQDDRMMLLQPLFMTSFLIDDFLDDKDFFGASTVVVLSASSKTAFSLAALLSRNRTCRVIGLTSDGNRDFVERLGCYDQVVTYDDVTSLPAEPSVVVDMAGSGPVLSSVHEHLRDEVKYSCQVGITHWEAGGLAGELPGAKPEFFFAPTQIEKRRKDWGSAGFQQRSAESWQTFLRESDGWLEIVQGRGPEDVERVYLATVEGRANPRQGHILSVE